MDIRISIDKVKIGYDAANEQYVLGFNTLEDLIDVYGQCKDIKRSIEAAET